MKISRMVPCLIAFISISTSLLAAANMPEPAKLVPQETLAFVSVSNCDALQAQWKKTSYYKLYTDPAMAQFVESLKSKWKENLFKGNAEIGDFFKDVNSAPTGQLVFALVSNEKTLKTGEPMLLTLSQWGPKVGSVKTAIEKALKKSVEEGAKRSKEEYRGYEIITVVQENKEPQEIKSRSESTSISNASLEKDRFADEGESNEEPENGPSLKPGPEEQIPEAAPEKAEPTVISYCFVNDTFVLSEDKEILKSTIAKMTGAGAAGLSDDPIYSSTMASLGPVHDIDVYVNMAKVIGIMSSADKSGSVNSQAAIFGLDNLAGLGMTVSLGRDASKPVITKGLLKVNGAKKGILKILDPQNEAVKMPKFVDSSNVSVTVINLSLKNAFDELFRVLGTISPGVAAVMNQPIVPGNETGQGRVEIKKDILDYLGNQIIIGKSLKKPFTTDSDPTGSVSAIAVTDSKALEKSISLLHTSVSQGKPEAKREFMGSTIYTFGMFPSFMPGLGSMAYMADELNKKEKESPKFAVSITDTYMIMGTEGDVEKTLRAMNNKENSPVTSQEWYERAKSTLPVQVGVAGLSDDRSSIEYFWWVLKKRSDDSKAGGPGLGAGAMVFGQLSGLADFKLLPDFEKVKKYFGVSSYYILSKPEGYYFESTMLDMK
jgi:hypothetical protein